MTDGEREVLERIGRLAEELPAATAESLAGRIAKTNASDWPKAAGYVVSDVQPSARRDAVLRVLTKWINAAPNLSPAVVAGALAGCSVRHERLRKEQCIELVWTGPDAQVIPVRHTEQALLEIIDSACNTLTVVSFAVYKIPNVRSALVGAAKRGVRVRLIIEGAEAGKAAADYDPLLPLGSEVLNSALVYCWPTEKRPVKPDGERAILHVKCAVADRQRLFVSSANLTHYAFHDNMELGVAIRGIRVAGQVEEHFNELIRTDVLRRIS